MTRRARPGPAGRSRLAWRRVARAVVWAVLAGSAALGLDIAAYASRSDAGPADAAVVLGAAVWADRPSPVFAARIDHAVGLYRSGRVPLLILTGGRSAGDSLSEAAAAAAYARARHVPRRALVCETASRVTEENLQGAAAVARARGLGRVLVVSDPLHMRRAVAMARDLGLDAHPSPTPTTRYRSLRSRAGFLLREMWYRAGYLVAGPTPSRRAVRVGPC